MEIEQTRAKEDRDDVKSYKVLHKIAPVRWLTSTIVRFPVPAFCCTGIIPLILLIILIFTALSGVFYLSPDVLLEDREDRAYISEHALKIARRDTINEVKQTKQ